MLSKEKRRADKLQNEMKLLKQPAVPDHSACNVVLEQERRHKEKALEQMKEMCDELNEIRKENELIKEDNKKLKENMLEIVTIKNELSMQNKAFLLQFDNMQHILVDKDKQIKDLLDRNPLNDFTVKHKIENLTTLHENEKEMWQCKQDALNKQIETLKSVKTELHNMVDQRKDELEATFKKHQLLKRNYESLAEKFEKEIGLKEKNVAGLVEAAKDMKKELLEMRNKNEKLEKELALLKEQNRVKEIEIGVLGDAKTLYEEQIKKYLCEKEAMYHIAKQFEQQIESARDKLKELEHCKYDLHQQLTEAHCMLQKEKEANKIQEKILEDNKDTMAMLKCKLKECSHKLYKCVREKEMLLCERDY